MARVTLSSAKQWLIGDWHTVLAMTTSVAGVVGARLKWSNGSAATTRSVQLVVDGTPIDSADKLATSGVQLLGGFDAPVTTGARIELQVRATGAQQAACMVNSAKTGFFGLGADAGTYIEVL